MHLISSSNSSPARKLKELLSNGSFQEALSLFKNLHCSSIHIPPSLFPSLLKATSSSSSSLPLSLQLHSSLLKTNLISHPITLNSLLSTYSSHSMVESARQVFDDMPHKDPISWNSMIHCYASRNGYFSESLKQFKKMSSEGFHPKPELAATVISACGRLGDLSLGRAIHARAVVNSTVEQCVLLPTSLVDMYSKCNDFDSAFDVFCRMPERNVVSWTAMISGCVADGRYNEAIDLLRKMVAEGIEPVRVSVVTILPACGGLNSLRLGKEVHGFALRRGYGSESRVIGGLVNMYSKCAGAIRLAMLVFERANERDTITWSSMMEATSGTGNGVGTFKLFSKMQRDGVEPNAVTMLAVVDACVGLASMDHGRVVLGYIVKYGFLSDVSLGNSLINMFAKCGCIDSSARVFLELMPVRDSISYTSMIQSYGFHGRGHEAMRVFEGMRELGLEPDSITLLAVLSACSHSGLVEESMKFFDSVSGDSGVGLNIEHYNCYVDLLARVGRIEQACDVVRKMPMRASRRVLTSLALACRFHGKLEVAEELGLELIDSEPLNAVNYTLLSMIYAEYGNWSGVEEIRRVMRERGLRKDSGSSRVKEGKF